MIKVMLLKGIDKQNFNIKRNVQRLINKSRSKMKNKYKMVKTLDISIKIEYKRLFFIIQNYIDLVNYISKNIFNRNKITYNYILAEKFKYNMNAL
jgi:hypothetical protein